MTLDARVAALAVGLSVATAAGASTAQVLDAERRYAECLDLARREPERAYDVALSWRDAGGGSPAKHCQSIALLGLGRAIEAARLLEDIAHEANLRHGPRLSAEALAQAGHAWLTAGDTARAVGLFAAALKLRPDDADLWIDRSIALAAAANYWEAIDDLNRAAELAPDRADIYVFRASAYRFVDAPELAADDLAEALRRDPSNPEAYLERGILRRLAGDSDAARRDWMLVLRLAPDSPAADSARANLARMDVKSP
jgi:tetratricopeptide (TPR) repeat protein